MAHDRVLLVYGLAIPLYGRLADRYGARPLFLLGVAVFSAGSLLSALAPTFSLLLAARIVQAIGGAAVPGLGMTLASRAYGPESRGAVLGVIAATIGLAGAIGPLLGGALSQAFGWQSIFVLNAAASVTIPVGMTILPRDEDRTGGSLDLVGGAALGLLVGGVVLIPTEGARSGWSSPLVLTGAAMVFIGLIALSARQMTARSPFIPQGVSPKPSLPRTRVDELFGHGRQRCGPHRFADSPCLFSRAVVFGSGADHASRRDFHLGVRRPGRSAHRSKRGATADLDGGSSHAPGGARSRVWIGEHTSGSNGIANSAQPGAGFSDAFLLLAIPVLLVMALSPALPRASVPSATGNPVSLRPESQTANSWVATCSVPWMSEWVENNGVLAASAREA